MTESVPGSTFEAAYAEGSPPWVIDAPQPAIVELERRGGIRGRVLEPGCGTGEHVLHLAALGYDVLGVDLVPAAVELARDGARRRGIEARFEVADALRLPAELDDRPFDTVVDSALFHIFGDVERAAYVRNLHAVCRPGAAVHVLALADTGPGFGPEVGEPVLREAFGAGWRLVELRPSSYRGVARGESAEAFGVAPGTLVDPPAWLATAVRL
ncbi:class I SAM-dependent methyltransferase [Saccharopolyspora cebuensis]|uniref:Class I SAM-dependent methyltransferase n=1 Tax=Saccharopolyspora cebuensis TaxID=418759 RepID=A0ABV4CT77_9PSEU